MLLVITTRRHDLVRLIRVISSPYGKMTPLLEEVGTQLINTFNDHTDRLDKIEITLTEHGTILEDHTKRLDRLEARMDRHEMILADHTKRLDRIEEKLDRLIVAVEHLKRRP